jgi:hypothetical protein
MAAEKTEQKQQAEGEVRVRNVRTEQSGGNLLNSVMEGGGNIIRVALGIITLPLSILPPEPREQVRNAMQDTIMAVAAFPANWADVVTKAVEDWSNQPVGQESGDSAKKS